MLKRTLGSMVNLDSACWNRSTQDRGLGTMSKATDGARGPPL